MSRAARVDDGHVPRHGPLRAEVLRVHGRNGLGRWPGSGLYAQHHHDQEQHVQRPAIDTRTHRYLPDTVCRLIPLLTCRSSHHRALAAQVQHRGRRAMQPKSVCLLSGSGTL